MIEKIAFPCFAAIFAGLIVYVVTDKKNNKVTEVDPAKVEGISKALYALQLELTRMIDDLRLAFTEKVDDLDKDFSVRLEGIEREIKTSRDKTRSTDICPATSKKETSNGN